jgi:hypothetical protein
LVQRAEQWRVAAFVMIVLQPIPNRHGDFGQVWNLRRASGLAKNFFRLQRLPRKRTTPNGFKKNVRLDWREVKISFTLRKTSLPAKPPMSASNQREAQMGASSRQKGDR